MTYWDGSNQSDPRREIVAEFRFFDDNDPATDYDRACDLSFGYMAPIVVNDGYGIVLGGYPMPCAVWLENSAVYLMRAQYNRGDDSMMSLIRLAESENAQDSFTINLPKGEVVVFDAAYAGDEAENSLTFAIEGGDYLVESFVLKAPDLFAVICRMQLPVAGMALPEDHAREVENS